MPEHVHLLWGTFTWILLHWASQQIKEEYFASERNKLIKIVEDICGNLPCPSCREHAVSYINRVPLANIQNKNDFVNYIYHFHNSVNIRGKKQYEPFTIMEKYNKVNFSLLMDSWNARFVYGNGIQRNDFMAKNRLLTLKKEINTYFKENSHKFLMS
tara:strand:+ start:6778 stop:7248 length:471 start_codon:yes stop_codon:yes gene_type:complete